MGTLYKEQFRNENPVQDIHVWEPCTYKKEGTLYMIKPWKRLAPVQGGDKGKVPHFSFSPSTGTRISFTKICLMANKLSLAFTMTVTMLT